MATNVDDVLTTLFIEEHARLERIVAHRMRDPELAADVVSEAFIRLQKRMAEGWVADDPPAWLTRVALNLAYSEGRHRRAGRRVTERLRAPAESPQPDDAAIGRDRLSRVFSALGALTPDDRSIVLAAANGADSAALAKHFGSTVGGARVRLYRARRHLHTALGDPV